LKLEQVDRKKLLPLLDELSGAVEDLLVTGLTTASDATVKTLHVSFQESSRMGLLRLGSTLRAVNEEVARFTKSEPGFSRRRLSFFLNRSWVLSKALKNAIDGNKADVFEKLMITPSPVALDKVEVVTVGVVKRAATSFCAFDFRLRAVADSGHIKKGANLVWSCIFPRAPGTSIPAEGYLHLPQKQKFKATVFLEPKQITIDKVTTSADATGCQRITMTEGSLVTAGAAFEDWEPLMQWDQAAALQRVQSHQPGPFDLEVEMQEEVFFKDWLIQDSWQPDESNIVFPVVTNLFPCEATVPKVGENSTLIAELEALIKKKKDRGVLYGLMHYERCKMVLQPLTVFDKKGPKHLMISSEKIDPKALLAALKF
jgi:hypothetical protein